MKKLGAAIIGCGTIHMNHVNAVIDSEYSQLIAAADIDKSKSFHVKNELGCDFYTDYKEMLKDPRIDVVHICTPHYLHSEMAIEAMKAGKHVLTEKPMALNISEGEKMIEAQKKYNKFLGVCFQNRYNSTSVKAKQIIDSNELGKVKGIKAFVTWYRDEDYYLKSGWRGFFKTEGGGVLINQSIHTLDLMQWLVGEVDFIKGHVDTRVLNNVIEVEDTAEATLYYSNGARGLFYATNCYTTNAPVEIEVNLEKGNIRLMDGKLYILKDGISTLVANDKDEIPKFKDYWGSSHKRLIENFYRSIIENCEFGYVRCEDGIMSLKLIDAIYKSSVSNEKIKLNKKIINKN